MRFLVEEGVYLPRCKGSLYSIVEGMEATTSCIQQVESMVLCQILVQGIKQGPIDIRTIHGERENLVNSHTRKRILE
jgi:hypothetical protein